MKTNKLIKTIVLFITCTITLTSLNAQTNATKRNAANKLWDNYGVKQSNRSLLPNEVPVNGVGNVDVRTINPDYNTLKNTLNDMIKKDGGMIKFSRNATINFNIPIRLAHDYSTRKLTRTIVIQGKGITFNGQNKTTIFTVVGNIRIVIQNATFKNANFNPGSMSNIGSAGPEIHRYRQGGGAIEMNMTAVPVSPGSKVKDIFGASLRVRKCNFIDNKVSHFKGIGENLNGAGIRLNNYTTGEVFGCYFKNNRAVTGGAIGGTSIRKLIIIDSFFDKNISNGYIDKRSGSSAYMKVVEGAGAIRVDRTIESIEIYKSIFKGNEANTKVSTIEVFSRPLKVNGKEELKLFPKGNTLIIDDCVFMDNKFHNFRNSNIAGGVQLDKPGFLSCIVFHAGGASGSFKGGTMKMTNTTFDNNTVGQANIRMINNFNFQKNVFANTKYVGGFGNAVDITRSALFLHDVYQKGVINESIFYNNEPNINNAKASDIMYWSSSVTSKVSLNKSLFLRANKNTGIEQVSTRYGSATRLFNGSNNHQYIKGLSSQDLNKLTKVSKNRSRLSNPGVASWYADRTFAGRKVKVLNLCANSVAAGVGGIAKCGVSRKEVIDSSITEELNDNKIKVNLYPNPAIDKITVAGVHVNDEITIINLNGQVVIKQKIKSEDNAVIDVSKLKSKGTFFIQVNGRSFKKFLKK